MTSSLTGPANRWSSCGACGPGIVQFVTPHGGVKGLDFTILVRMGKDRAADEFCVLPTRVLREEIAARETAYIGQLKKVGTFRKNAGIGPSGSSPARTAGLRVDTG